MKRIRKSNRRLITEQISGPTCYACSNGQVVSNNSWNDPIFLETGYWPTDGIPAVNYMQEFCVVQGHGYSDNGMVAPYTQYDATVNLSANLPGLLSINEYWFTDQAQVQFMCTSGSTSNMEWYCPGTPAGCYSVPLGTPPNDPNDYGPEQTLQDCQMLCQVQTLGCLDPNAINYDPTAMLPCDGMLPGSPPCVPGTPPGPDCCCDYGPNDEWCCGGGITGVGQCIQVPIGTCNQQSMGTGYAGGPYIDQQDCQANGCGGGGQTVGCTDPTAFNFDPNAIGCPDPMGNPDPNDTSCCQNFLVCEDSFGMIGDPVGVMLNGGACCVCDNPGGTPWGGNGCTLETDPNNYDPAWVYHNPDDMQNWTGCAGCDNSTNCSGGPPAYWCEVLPCQIPPCPTQCVGPGPQPPNAVGGPYIDQQDCQANGCGTMGSIAGCNDPQCNNFDPNAIGCPDPMGNPDPNDQSCCTGCGMPIPGCLDTTSPNFDPSATVDCAGNPVPPGGGFGDTSCCGVSPILGCMDQDAFNFDPSATQDDGSCDYGWRCGMLPSGGAVDEAINLPTGPAQSMPTGCMPGTATNPGVFTSEAFCLSQNTKIPNGCGGTDMGAKVKDIEKGEKESERRKRGEDEKERERKQELREEFTRMKTLWRHKI